MGSGLFYINMALQDRRNHSSVLFAEKDSPQLHHPTYEFKERKKLTV